MTLSWRRLLSMAKFCVTAVSMVCETVVFQKKEKIQHTKPFCQMELNNIPRLSPCNGATLNIEEVSALEVHMLKRKLEENLAGKMYFWGKIYGTREKDYLIVYNINPFQEFPDKKYYYCTTLDYTLKALPPISKEYESIAEKIIMPFTGDGNFSAFDGEEEEEPTEEDPEAPKPPRFREEHRLSYNVKKIDHDCSLIPRGALVVDATKKVIPNVFFEGLSFHTASEPRAYMHFRRPESLQGLALMKKPGIIKSGDFLDCINKDVPSEMWTITKDGSGAVAYVRNLYWEGYAFYALIGSNEYGGAYFGSGVPNYDIAFML